MFVSADMRQYGVTGGVELYWPLPKEMYLKIAVDLRQSLPQMNHDQIVAQEATLDSFVDHSKWLRVSEWIPLVSQIHEEGEPIQLTSWWAKREGFMQRYVAAANEFRAEMELAEKVANNLKRNTQIASKIVEMIITYSNLGCRVRQSYGSDRIDVTLVAGCDKGDVAMLVLGTITDGNYKGSCYTRLTDLSDGNWRTPIAINKAVLWLKKQPDIEAVSMDVLWNIAFGVGDTDGDSYLPI